MSGCRLGRVNQRPGSKSYRQEDTLMDTVAGMASCDQLQGVPKKMSFSGNTAITTFKLIQNAKVGGVLEYSGYLLPDGH